MINDAFSNRIVVPGKNWTAESIAKYNIDSPLMLVAEMVDSFRFVEPTLPITAPPLLSLDDDAVRGMLSSIIYRQRNEAEGRMISDTQSLALCATS